MKTRAETIKLRMDSINTAIGLYNTAKGFYTTWKSKGTEKDYVISIPEDDPSFQTVSAAILSQLPVERRRRITARQERYGSGVVVAYEATKPDDIIIGGHNVRVAYESDSGSKGGKAAKGNTDSLIDWISLGKGTLVFYCGTSHASDAVLEFIRDAVEDKEAARQGPRLWIATKWGEWQSQSEVMSRPLNTVVLPKGQIEDIEADIRKFIDDEEAYIRLGLPWHRGYLFYGPPGTGKTSTARAIAAHLELDVHYMPLGDLSTDTDLGRLMQHVSPRSVLLLEDVDVMKAAKDRDTQQDGAARGVSSAGLLNALDGVITPHGLITIMTTNHLGKLDPALVRPGRCDRRFEMSYLDDDQFERLVYTMTPYKRGLPSIDGCSVTPSQVVEVIKETLGENEMVVGRALWKAFGGELEG